MENKGVKFYPNGNWLYIKIYCGDKTAEKILGNEVYRFVTENPTLFEKFFFIRYFDEFSHLRIRFYNSESKRNLGLQFDFISSLQNYIESGLIHKVTIDTYQREMERYGDDLIEEAETIFYHDSISCLKMLNLFAQIEEAEKYRIVMSLRGIQELVQDFNLTLDQKYTFSKMIQTSFFREFGAHPSLQKQLNDKYRSYQKMMFSHLDTAQDEANEIEEAIQFFAERSVSIKESVMCIIDKVENEQKLFDLLASYVHMYLNRMFVSEQRKYELVLYHFLEKYYNSQLALKKYKK